MAVGIVCTKANPALIKWCRIEGGFTTEQVAKWLGSDKTLVEGLEDGTEYPTLSHLKKMSEHYKRPIGVFFLPKPPPGTRQPKDYRAHGGKTSPVLLRSIRRARFVQERLHELATEKETAADMWANANSVSQNAKRAKQWLGLSEHEQTKNRDIRGFYKLLMGRLEERGISVLQHSFPSSEAKAYSFAEAPKIIVLTTNDGYIGSRIFSVMHELCHMSHGHSGLCIPQGDGASYARERACDKFATEFLMPAKLIETMAVGKPKAELLDDEFLRTAAETLKTSMYALLIRLREYDYVRPGDVAAKKAAWAKIPRSKGGFATTTRAQKAIKENGMPFTRIVLKAYATDRITTAEASYMLNINQSYINDVGARALAP